MPVLPFDILLQTATQKANEFGKAFAPAYYRVIKRGTDALQNPLIQRSLIQSLNAAAVPDYISRSAIQEPVPTAAKLAFLHPVTSGFITPFMTAGALKGLGGGLFSESTFPAALGEGIKGAIQPFTNKPLGAKELGDEMIKANAPWWAAGAADTAIDIFSFGRSGIKSIIDIAKGDAVRQQLINKGKGWAKASTGAIYADAPGQVRPYAEAAGKVANLSRIDPGLRKTNWWDVRNITRRIEEELQKDLSYKPSHLLLAPPKDSFTLYGGVPIKSKKEAQLSWIKNYTITGKNQLAGTGGIGVIKPGMSLVQKWADAISEALGTRPSAVQESKDPSFFGSAGHRGIKVNLEKHFEDGVDERSYKNLAHTVAEEKAHEMEQQLGTYNYPRFLAGMKAIGADTYQTMIHGNIKGEPFTSIPWSIFKSVLSEKPNAFVSGVTFGGNASPLDDKADLSNIEMELSKMKKRLQIQRSASLAKAQFLINKRAEQDPAIVKAWKEVAVSQAAKGGIDFEAAKTYNVFNMLQGKAYRDASLLIYDNPKMTKTEFMSYARLSSEGHAPAVREDLVRKYENTWEHLKRQIDESRVDLYKKKRGTEVAKESPVVKTFEAIKEPLKEVDLFGNDLNPPAPPTPPGPPIQGEFVFPEKPYVKREYGTIGPMQRFSNPNLYAHHAGYGPEHDILSRALDQYHIERQRIDTLGKKMEEEFIKGSNLPWYAKVSGDKIKELKQDFELALEDPKNDLSSFGPELQRLGEEMRKEYQKMFLEENKARILRGEKPYEYREGYVRRMYKDKIIEGIKKEQEPDPMLTSGFDPGLDDRVFFGPEIRRTERISEGARLFDPIKSFITRKKEHYREMLIKPALIEVNNRVQELAARGNAMPRDIIDQLNFFIKHSVKGMPMPLDNQLNKAMGDIPFIAAILGDRPFNKLTQGLLKLQYLGTLWGNLKQYTRNPLQSLHHISMYGVPNALKALNNMVFKGARANESFEKQIREPFIGQERIGEKKGVWKKLDDLGFKPLRDTDMFNLIHAYETAKVWGRSLEVNKGWQQKMTALEKQNGVPAGSYQWTAEDTARESEFAIQCAQFKYTITGMPEIYRNQLGKAVGGLFSWPMNYWNTYLRELHYRFWNGTTGWANSEGIHKPIPTSARIASLRYLILAGAVTMIATAVGAEVGSQFFLGTIPRGPNPITSTAIGLVQLLMGNYRSDNRLIGEGKYLLKSGLKAMFPGGNLIRGIAKVQEGGSLADLFRYPIKKKNAPLPTRRNIRYPMTKDMKKEGAPSKSGISWLQQK